jgi:hypothetical protein
MDLLSKVSNKINYSIAKSIEDPEADRYAREREQQRAQDAAAAQRQAEQNAATAAAAAAKIQSDQQASNMKDRSQFKPGRAIGNVASGIMNAFLKLILVIIILYAGHLCANEAIGYNAPFRIFSFICGQIFFWFVIPRFLIRRYWFGLPNHNYAFLPLSTYVPVTDAEKILLKPFCYVEDINYAAAKAAVDLLYSSAYERSLIVDPDEPKGPPRPACYPNPQYGGNG